LKNAKVVEGQIAVPGLDRGLAAVPGPVAGPGLAAVPGHEAGPGKTQGPNPGPNQEVVPNLETEMIQRKMEEKTLVQGPEAGPERTLGPNPGPIPNRNLDLGLVQEMIKEI